MIRNVWILVHLSDDGPFISWRQLQLRWEKSARNFFKKGFQAGKPCHNCSAWTSWHPTCCRLGLFLKHRRNLWQKRVAKLLRRKLRSVIQIRTLTRKKKRNTERSVLGNVCLLWLMSGSFVSVKDCLTKCMRLFTKLGRMQQQYGNWKETTRNCENVQTEVKARVP